MGMSGRIKDQRLWYVGAILWGFAEATVFFIVPDLLLTSAVLVFGFAVALRLSLAAAAGAVLGGLLMFTYGAVNADSARALVNAVPLVGGDLMARVASEMTGANSVSWPINLALGAISGAPYKIYAVEAGAMGFNPVLFAVVSFVARTLRFLLAISITAGGFVLASRLGLARWRGPGLALAWAAIYLFYTYVRLTVS